MKSFISPELLADNATSVHKEDVIRYYTESELLVLKSELADATVQLAQRSSLIADIKSILKDDDEDTITSVLAVCHNRKIEGVMGTKSLSNFISNTSKAINVGHTRSL
jgi:translation initiation factor RLI1